MALHSGNFAQVTPGLRLLDEDPDHYVFACYRNVGFFGWRRQITAEAVTRLAEVTEPLYQAGGRVSVVHLADAQVGLPTAEAREVFGRLVRERDGQRGSLAIVLLGGGGFWTSAIRSFLTGMRMVASQKFECGLHENVSEAAAWFAGSHGQTTGVQLEPGLVQLLMDETIERCRTVGVSSAVR